MRRIHMASVLCGLLVAASAAFAQDGARAILEKAIQAQGGEAKVAKLRTMRIKVEGTTDLVPGQPNLPFTMEDTWRMPHQYKTTSSFQLMGKKFTQTQVIDGDKGWIQIDGQVQDMPKDALAEMKEQKYAEDLDRLGFLGEKGIEFSALAEIQGEGKPAVGVLVKSKGHRDVKLYFDKASGLLVKREQRVLDPSSGKEVRQEVLFSDYQEKDGLKHYQKIVALRDGKKVIDAKVTEVEFFEKLDAKVFAKP
jgi:zinc protease